MASISKNEITKFWEWFSSHVEELSQSSLTDTVIQELESHLFVIGNYDWEIGPGRREPCMFALSPRGDAQLLEQTKQVISEAPFLQGWEFQPTKPPRNWNVVFSLDVGGKDIEIDGKNWEFIAYKFKDGTFDLVFKPNSTEGLSADQLHWAATIIADGELGEEFRMKHVHTIEIVEFWDATVVKSAKKVDRKLVQLMQ